MKRIVIQILFILSFVSCYSQNTINSNEDGVWFAEENATFQGGDINNFNSWVKERVIVPTEATENGLLQKGIYQFSIDTTGSICDIKVIRSSHPAFDSTFVLLLKKSPIWVPARHASKLVKQNFIIPIHIELQ